MKKRLLPVLTGLLVCICLCGRGVPALAADLDEVQPEPPVVVFDEPAEADEVAMPSVDELEIGEDATMGEDDAAPEDEESCEACDEDETLQNGRADTSAGIDMSKEKVTLVCGKSVKLKAYADDENITRSVSWSSSNTKVATVKAGKVTGVGFGKCVITAKIDGQKTECTVQVKPGQVSLESLKKASASKVTIKWEKISNVTGYQLYRATSKDGIYSRIKTISDDDTCSYTNTVIRNKKYYYKIRAYYKDSSGNYYYGAWSEIKDITM